MNVSLLSRFLRLFFHHFYHEFAWTYDLVAWVVSVGRWNLWIEAALPFLHGNDILELGFGRGHLQRQLLTQNGRRVFGLDESIQMAQLARRRLCGIRGLKAASLTRGRAQELPYPAASFDTVVSTFPSEYIFDPATLGEIRRVLRGSGRLVVLPGASIVGRGITDRVAAWVFQVTHQAPASPNEFITSRLKGLLGTAGFEFEFRTIEIAASVVYVIEAVRSG